MSSKLPDFFQVRIKQTNVEKTMSENDFMSTIPYWFSITDTELYDILGGANFENDDFACEPRYISAD